MEQFVLRLVVFCNGLHIGEPRFGEVLLGLHDFQDHTHDELVRAARIVRVDNVMRPYLEAIVA